MAYRGSGFNLGFGFGVTPWVKRLLIANGAVFALQLVLPIGGPLAFVPSQVLFRPWTPITYMFVHAGFFHVFFNMLVLFFFGPPLESRWGSSEFIRFYVISGLGGAVFSFVFAFSHPVVGASAAVYGVMLAFAMNWPNAPVWVMGIIPIKVKWLVLFLLVVSLVNGAAGSADGTAHFAHLGGFAGAFLYLKFSDSATRRWEQWRKRFSRPRLKVVSGGSRDEPARRGPSRGSRRGRDEDRLMDELDRVLDKISAEGISSLTPKERRILDEASRRYRQN